MEHNELSVIVEANDNVSSKLENIRMSNNPWLCGCKGIVTIDFINKYSKKVKIIYITLYNIYVLSAKFYDRQPNIHPDVCMKNVWLPVININRLPNFI